ncbi:hypothetical protein LOD99_6899 [Oopsacas minuta]|uniref:Uncharacterized protein n=1 Tax=Oopsacas minuta TaxID=111878 RepID=A0AAV7JKM7_9METZ|nr:hypothetical protein LOD99_6899 [Oopsacas minuta]
MDDQLYNQILHFFISNENKYPGEIYKLPAEKRVNAKSQFRQTVKPYTLKDGVLMHAEKQVLRKSGVDAVLKMCHDNPVTGGHFGRDKTYQKIASRFYWKGMKQEIEIYCKQCIKCFEVNPKLKMDRPPLSSIRVPSQVWSLVGIDLIGPLQESTSGNKYIVAISDHFSKWSEASAIPDKTSKSVADFLYLVVCRLGCMDTLISDQGREFVNEVIDYLLDILQTEHRISSAYHPETNGQRERDNRTLKSALVKLVNERGDDWDMYIPGILFAYHTSIHASTKCTPFQAMYCRSAKLPIDLSIKPPKSIEQANPKVLQAFGMMREAINAKIDLNITNAQKHQKRNFDNRHSNSKVLSPGATVYIKNSKQIHRMGSKMEPRWIGPYKIIELLDKGRAILENINTDNKDEDAKSMKKKTISISHSKIKKLECKDELVLTGVKQGVKQFNPNRLFSPISADSRKNVAKVLNLNICKTQYFGKPGFLSKPARIYRTKGDGNCYFRSISYILTGSEDSHIIIRNKVVHHMCGSLSETLRKYLSQTVANYVSESAIDSSGVWATEAEILATANLIQHDIVVYAKSGDSMEWLTYPASFTLTETTETALYLENLAEHFNIVINIQ